MKEILNAPAVSNEWNSHEVSEEYKVISEAVKKDIFPIVEKLVSWKLNHMGNPECTNERFEYHTDAIELFFMNMTDDILGYLNEIEAIYSDERKEVVKSTPNECSIDDLPF